MGAIKTLLVEARQKLPVLLGVVGLAKRSCLVSRRTLLIGLPVLMTAIVILFCAVNIPVLDDWELVPILQHIHAGHWYLHDFWQQHNEHRLFFPTIVIILLALASRWNVLLICFVSLGVAISSFMLLSRAIVATHNLKQLPWAIVFLLALIWFSPVQQENWLWGWQLEWFMNILGVVLVIRGIVSIKRSSLSVAQAILIAGGAIFAQYSLGNGTLVWPLIVLCLLYLGIEVWQTVTFFVVGCAATLLYYRHYTNPAEPSKVLALHHPMALSLYIFAYLGRPLSFLYRPAVLVGFLLLCVFVGLTMYLFFKRKADFRDTLPWFALGYYAIGSAIITALARLGYGTREAMSSRYTTVSSLLLISFILVIWQNKITVYHWVDVFGGRVKYAARPLLVVLYVLVLLNVLWGVRASINRHQQLETIKECTSNSRPTQECLLSTYPNTTVVAARLKYVKVMRYTSY